jgi:3-hydroxybutyryl-CoA dehydrogenase
MKIAVITNEELKEELLAQGMADELEVDWLTEINPVPGAIAYIDLLFNHSTERINKLKTLQPATIIINAVIQTLESMPAGFIRVNGWNSFLKRPVMEAAGAANDRAAAAMVFSSFHKKIEWVPDIPGFITARVISMIINEAYFGLEENISSKAEIDTAMKLGTNYPYGPFEWGAKIGLKHIDDLLSRLVQENTRYQPSGQLQKEARS